jgi:chromosome segregation ATPase
MVEKIYAENFKGLVFEDKIGKQTLFVGNVGSGKSSRTMALELLLTGTVHSAGLSKKPADIFHALAAADDHKITVGAVIGGKTYERTLTMTKTGSVRQSYSINGSSAKQADFNAAIAGTGVQVADIHAFFSLSDTKKIEHLFTLYPPYIDVASLNKEINSTNDDLKEAQALAKSKRDMAAQLEKDRSEMELPGMTLAEVTAQRKQAEEELETVRTELEKARQEAYEAQQQRKAEDAAEQVKNQQSEYNWSYDCTPEDPQPQPPQDTVQRDGRAHREEADDTSSGLQKVMDVLQSQQCGATCPAMMVCKRELRRVESC